jgi:hypothetical protein
MLLLNRDREQLSSKILCCTAIYMMQLLPLMKMLVFLVRWDYTTSHLEASKGPKVSWNLNGRNRQKWDVHQVFCASR